MAVLAIGAIMSFGLAMYVSLNGGFPLLETAHAILFGVMALVLASNRSDATLMAACRECGSLRGELDFCIGCGSIKGVAS